MRVANAPMPPVKVGSKMTRKWRNGVLVGIVLVACLFGVVRFFKPWTTPLQPKVICWDGGFEYARTTTPRDKFAECIKNNANTFLARDYAETKDAAKAFLTLLVAVFVASITFSEKVVDMTRADRGPRRAMVSAWIMILVAIIACGMGLVSMMVAAAAATYKPYLNFRTLSDRGVGLLILAGISFGGGLMSLLVAGIMALDARFTQGPARPVGNSAAGKDNGEPDVSSRALPPN